MDKETRTLAGRVSHWLQSRDAGLLSQTVLDEVAFTGIATRLIELAWSEQLAEECLCEIYWVEDCEPQPMTQESGFLLRVVNTDDYGKVLYSQRPAHTRVEALKQALADVAARLKEA